MFSWDDRTPFKAGELFVFVGAGVSVGSPACLPMFNPIRDELLRQLRASEFVPNGSVSVAEPSERQQATAGLAPEPFMQAIQQGGADLVGWLRAVLDSAPGPNAVHEVLARLASEGALVWTVNFDRLIEQANPAVPVLAWPAEPTPKVLLRAGAHRVDVRCDAEVPGAERARGLPDF